MKIRTMEDANRFRLALVPVDLAFHASEQRWGVGRLERLQSPATLASYQRGWDAYRVALEDGDAGAVERIGSKMIAALAFMDSEASAAGHQPLVPDCWETPMGDGTVLVVCRTQAEQTAVLRGEERLPPDVTVSIRDRHEGRALLVVTMAEIVRLMALAEAKLFGVKWEGTPAYSGVQLEEGAAADIVRKGFPLEAPLAAETPKAVTLDF